MGTTRFKATVGAALLAAGLAGLVGMQAQGHHSVAAFDRANTFTLSGTVTEFKYANPHTWIRVMVPDGEGGERQWDLEGGAVNTLMRQGWTSRTLQPGMKVKLLVAPRRDGRDGGEWLLLLEINSAPFQSIAEIQPAGE